VVVEIEMGDYLIILSGTIDIISKKPDNGPYTLMDFKTSKAEWKPEQFDAKMQKFIYPWLLSKLV
jgi:RecB family exonuclease